MTKLEGIELRDWFAGMAMMGMISCQDLMNELSTSVNSKEAVRDVVADWSYKQADAMLKVRRNHENQQQDAQQEIENKQTEEKQTFPSFNLS